MQEEREEQVATLIQPTEYVRHLNQVAGLTTQHVIFLKRKFLSGSGWELVGFPVAECARVKYADERPALIVLSGALLVGLIAFVLYMLVRTWDRLDPGTRIPIGLLALAGLYGVRWVLGARRHRLVFTMKDRSDLVWKSRPGDHQLKKAAADRVVEFARARGILDASRLTRR